VFSEPEDRVHLRKKQKTQHRLVFGFKSDLQAGHSKKYWQESSAIFKFSHARKTGKLSLKNN
jgi:hypothetical protein